MGGSVLLSLPAAGPAAAILPSDQIYMSDIDTLLQPIAGEAPCGVDMVFSAEFDAIREARRHDDPNLDQGDWVIDIKEADWPEVIRICTTVLREQSKDVRVASPACATAICWWTACAATTGTACIPFRTRATCSSAWATWPGCWHARNS
jgi:hypothetical protein